MKLKRYLLFFTILAAALIPASSIKGQYAEEEVSEKYMKLSLLFSEMENAFSRGQYGDVINSSDKLNDIGFTYNDLEEDGETENSNERAVWIDIIWFRGISENNIGKYQEAVEDFAFVLGNAKNPSLHVYTFYAYALNKIDDTKKAISVLEKGVEDLEDKISDSDMYDLLWDLGWYYYLDKQYKKTINVGFECSEINLYSTGPLFNASLAFLALKDDNNAMRYFLKAFNSSFLYDDEFQDWIFKSVIEDVNNYIKEHGESNILSTMLFLPYKALDEMASHIHSVYLINEPLGTYTDLVDDPTAQFLYVIASAYSIKENSSIEKYLIELRNCCPSYIEKSKNDSDFDWYYSTHRDRKVDRPKQKFDKPKQQINKHKQKIDKHKQQVNKHKQKINKPKQKVNKPKHIKKKRR
ncbi:MAG: hypothetical protein FWH53_01240 [Leptospirales bacterium]|nr:hypothetical protein [Leptospirales bacterium]